ncbi:unnamed protein product [Candidula unifasciata]|uniref:TM2 domain-containing protein n=1 Tax=Candidula unifasciata TaxID=100452 RepID=A0A8S3YPX9_9EUPU|nr:unnamed protein product [Candidula unifasciata]
MSNWENKKSITHSYMSAQTSNGQTLPPPPSAPPDNSNLIAATLPVSQSYGNGLNQPTVYVTYPSTDQVSSVGTIHRIQYNKSLVEAYLLGASPFGILGAHHFYLRRYSWGILYIFTFALLGFGYLIDLFRMPCLVKHANNKIKNPEKDEKTISDAYTLWFPFGLLGFHHYYLGNHGCGILYTLTGGLFGIGWIVDAFRIPGLVRASNESQFNQAKAKSACVAAGLALCPFGILGAHHYYLRRPIWGLVYTFTCGLMGFGWLVDLFRLPVLIKRANKIILGNLNGNLKTLDDAYILWFPFGMLGFHHFYLQRPVWGFLYFFTFGLVGIGWLVDMCRIPYLVKQTNAKIEAENEQRQLLSGSAGHTNTPSVYVSSFSGPNAQGYPNYSVGNPTAPILTNPPQLFFSYPQAAYGYPPSFQEHPNNAVRAMDANAPPAYSWDMGSTTIGQHLVADIAPPPYQPAEPACAGHQAEDLPEKTGYAGETKTPRN